MAGRPRKPTALHLISGGLRAAEKRDRADEPKTALKAPTAPKHLEPDEREAWARFAKSAMAMRVLSEHDWPALEQLACSYAEAQRLRAFLRKHGHTYTTITTQGSKMLRTRPEAKLLRDANREMLNLLGRFGLSPSDRARVKATPGTETTKDPEDQDEEFT